MFIDQNCFSNTYYLPSTTLEIKGRRLNGMEALPLSGAWREQRDWSITEQWDAHGKEDACEKKLPQEEPPPLRGQERLQSAGAWKSQQCWERYFRVLFSAEATRPRA